MKTFRAIDTSKLIRKICDDAVPDGNECPERNRMLFNTVFLFTITASFNEYSLKHTLPSRKPRFFFVRMATEANNLTSSAMCQKLARREKLRWKNNFQVEIHEDTKIEVNH